MLCSRNCGISTPTALLSLIMPPTIASTLTEESKRVWKAMKKQQIIDWLLSKEVDPSVLPPHTNMTVLELRELCEIVAPPMERELVRLGRSFGIPVIYSPVAHPELNPIEEIWAYCKSIVLSRNGVTTWQSKSGFLMSELEGHIKHAVGSMNGHLRSKSEDKVLQREASYLAMADADEVEAEEVEGSDVDLDGLSLE